MTFKPAFKPPKKVKETALWFLFEDYKLLIKQQDEQVLIPQSRDLKTLDITPQERQYLGSLDGRPCYAGELEKGRAFSHSFALNGIRTLFGRLEDELMWIAGLANQLVAWNQHHRFCGKCGHLTEYKTDERARACLQCGLINYPRLSPAIIVAVLRDERILLAHSQRFPAKFYSVLAGFVEPGESLEECVKREILEEVGISVKNIRYFGSQPWPFPDSLMIAFTAEYAGGEIKADPAEIVDAGWFSADSLPPVPPKLSIARHLIDWFTEHKPPK